MSTMKTFEVTITFQAEFPSDIKTVEPLDLFSVVAEATRCALDCGLVDIDINPLPVPNEQVI